ncbi:hypothetical protein EVAR_86015_1 [Eumeta japonica]|uniref:Uncharacterized protein n=1 Tax=Eumeta variegata TaxID=151549 RepID=A0A4C1UJ62_EUMVA|nr:hypothetical protein EVAR_86015_1 [Eumeta japonica]
MASCSGETPRIVIEFSCRRRRPLARFTGSDLVHLIETFVSAVVNQRNAGRSRCLTSSANWPRDACGFSRHVNVLVVTREFEETITELKGFSGLLEESMFRPRYMYSKKISNYLREVRRAPQSKYDNTFQQKRVSAESDGWWGL